MIDRYTPEILDKAIALKETGLTWPQVAARMSLSSNSLKRTVSYYRRGLWTPIRNDQERERLRIADLFRNEGLRICEIARITGSSLCSITHRLDSIGLDAEERARIVKERQTLRIAA